MDYKNIRVKKTKSGVSDENSSNFQKRLTVQYLVSQILASGEGTKADFQKILEVIAWAFDWDAGLFWRLNENAEKLTMYAGWSVNDKKVAQFVKASSKLLVSKNISFVGRIWKSGKPIWGVDIFKRSYYQRQKEASKAGFVSAFGFPIKTNGVVYGVLEFYTKEKRKSDESITKIVDSISFQIGQFLSSKESEQSNRNANRQLQALFQSIPDGVTVENWKGEIKYANQEAARLFGYKSADVLQRENIRKLFTKFEIFNKSGKKITYKDLPAALAFKFNKNYSSILNFKDKRSQKERWFNVKASLVENGGESLLVVKVFHDITTQLVEQKEREIFLGLVSHEFRSPLASVKAYIQLTQRRLKSKDYKEIDGFVNSVDEQTDRLVKLINNWLDATRVSAGLLRLNKKTVDYGVLLNDVIRDFQLVNKDNPIRKKGFKSINIYVDPDRITQVVINLLSNAVKFSKKDKEIVVNLSRTNDSIVTSVKDLGPGIPPDKQKEIFRLYKKVTDKSSKGLGMGLFISAAIVKAHKGELWYSGKEGEGAVFSFTLPLTRNR